MLLFLIECQSVIVPILFKLPSCCCHQATDLHTMGFVAFFLLGDRLQRCCEPATIFCLPVYKFNHTLYERKKIIISECISATDRNNEFQLRVLLRDEMLLRSVFSAKDLIFYTVRKLAKKSLLNFWAQKFIICDCIFWCILIWFWLVFKWDFWYDFQTL